MSTKVIETEPSVSASPQTGVVHRKAVSLHAGATAALPLPPILATEHLLIQVRQVAQHLSEIRRLESAYQDLYAQMIRHLKEIPSTPDQMEADWQTAWAFANLRILESREVDFTQLEVSAYPDLEAVWLKRIKELKAYYIWKAGGSNDPVENYHQASAAIRQLLLERPQASAQSFEPVKRYLEERYLKLGNSAMLDETKDATWQLIDRKARRIQDMTREYDERTNWFRARLYASMFYENIIGAVLDNDEQKTRTILKAFEFSKAPENRYLVINGFETAIAITFLDKAAVRHVLEHPEWYDFSMEPLADWPDTVRMPSGMRFDRDDRQLILDGLMTDQDERDLLAQLTDERLRVAVARLCAQSRLRPFEAQIL